MIGAEVKHKSDFGILPNAQKEEAMPESPMPAYITSLIRHFEDLRDGTHGRAANRKDKAAYFENVVHTLTPIAHHVPDE